MSVEVCLILTISGAAVFMDFLMEKVVNSFICIGILAGIFYQIHRSGMKGLFFYFLGMMLPFVLLLPLFYFRMLGAGDIKLLCVLGGIIGQEAILKVIVCAFVLGAILSFAFLISCGNLRERCFYLVHYLYQYAITREKTPYIQKGKRAENFHFTVPVFLGIMLYVGGFY